MILADSSVWIDHINRGVAIVPRLLERQQILLHPFVIGEIALGSLRRRAAVLKDLECLPQADVASDQEVRGLVEHFALFGCGIGYVDAHLLASAKLNNAQLWTQDKCLQSAAFKVGLTRSH